MGKLKSLLIPLAPFLVATFTVTSLYSANASRLDADQMITPLVFALFVAGLFYLIFWLCKWTAGAAGWVAAGFTVVFLLWNIMPWWVDVLALIYFLILGIKWQRYTKPSGVLISFVAIIAILASGVQAGVAIHGKADSMGDVEPAHVIEGQPNIYFIVPDRMPSPDAMRESGINPDFTVNSLRELGFYVKDNQLSADPYTVDYEGEAYTTRTMRFFASSLNGGIEIPMDISYQDCRSMMRNNSLFEELHDNGYMIINVASWFNETSYFPSADINLAYHDIGFLESVFRNELSTAFFERTMIYGLNFRLLESDNLQRRVETGRLNWQTENILEVAEYDNASTFIIAHILMPHEPYVYADNSLSIPEQYYANIEYALEFIPELAASIREADPSATIIIQSDEGMAYRKPVELNYDLSPTQWSGVFTAWYLPDYAGDLSNIEHNEILGFVIH